MGNKWVEIWGQAHSNLSHFYYPSAEKTYRFVINSAISATAVNIELSNEFSRNDVYIGNITAALCNKNGKLLSEAKKVTVCGKNEFVLKKGESIVSDSIEISLEADTYFAVSIFVIKGDLRSGNLLNNINLITVKGDVSNKTEIFNEKRKRDTVIRVAGKVLNLYLHKPVPLIKSVNGLNNTDASSIIVFGDSISQQGFWTNRLEERIRAEYPGKFTLINKSVMGSRVLRDFSPRFPCRGLFGLSALNRISRDILSRSDCRFAIIALGTNDFLQYGTIAAPRNEKPSPEDVFLAVKRMCDMLKDKGIKPIVVNTVKFGYCIDSRPEKERLASQYNDLLKENRSEFCLLFDQAELLRDSKKDNCTAKEYLGKDNLHFNENGGRFVADSFPLQIFECSDS